MFPYLPVKWLVAGGIVFFVATFSYLKGAESVRRDFDAYKAKIVLEDTKRKAKQAEVTTTVITKYVDRVQIVKEKSNAINKEIDANVSGTCPGAAGVYHDSAALQVPPAPRDTHEGTTDAKALTSTIAKNYNTCHEVREQLKALQEWVKQNAALDNK
jgi:hypothetical protein